ncbi:hypothetical protein GCM10020218_033190 [Dactylosporangium vinaceum]
MSGRSMLMPTTPRPLRFAPYRSRRHLRKLRRRPELRAVTLMSGHSAALRTAHAGTSASSGADLSSEL